MFFKKFNFFYFYRILKKIHEVLPDFLGTLNFPQIFKKLSDSNYQIFKIL